MSTYLSPGQLSLYLGVAEKTVYRWLARGLIPGAFKLGGRWFVHQAKLDEGLEKLAKPPANRGLPNPHGL
jgi:excisionase family DNA binding protein